MSRLPTNTGPRSQCDGGASTRAGAVAVVAAALVVGTTIAVDPRGLAPFGPAKWAIATTAVLALAALAGRRRLRLVRQPTLLLAALVAWTGVAAAAGLDPLYAWVGTPERHWGVVAWLLCFLSFCVGQALTARESRAVATAMCAAGGLAGLWATAELLGWQPFDLAGVTTRPGGPFGSSAYLGAAAALLAPVGIGIAADPRASQRGRAIGAAAGASAGTALVASGARAAWAATAFVLAVVVVVRWRPRRMPVVLGGACLVVALVLATGAGSRLAGLATDERGGVRGRLDEWRVAVRVVAAHPVVGVGPEGYRVAFADAVDREYETAHGRHPLPDRAHAAVLDVAVATGLPGALAYVALLALLARLLVRAVRRGTPVVAGVAVGVLAYFAQSLVLFPIPELDVVAWLGAGMVVAAVARTDETVRVAAPRAVAVVLGATAMVAAVLGVLDVAADRAARHALESASGEGGDRAAELRPDALRYHLVAARAHAASGRLDTAERRLRRALKLSPGDPVARAELGGVLLAQARATEAPTDVARARRYLEALVARDGVNAEAYLRLGLVRALDGDDGGAERAWLTAEQLAPRSAAASTNLALAYARAGRTADARAAALRALGRDPYDERAAQVLRITDGT